MNRWGWLLAAAIVLLFAVRNLPWHLDDYDQAKQAYVSYEMVHGGNWLFQHTPRQEIATKPPMVGWISASLYLATRSWDLAWRLPPFAAALVLLWLLWREGNRSYPVWGGMLAAGCFALNGLAPRIATLVRTDMPLALFIFLAGWLIWTHIRDAKPWSTGARWGMFLVVLFTMLTKGPIVYAFLLPGLLAFLLIAKRSGWKTHAWCGWWPLFGPLLLFGGWAIAGALTDKGFYEQVVMKEFMGRFDETVHKSQPWYFYGHLLLRSIPWTILWFGLVAGFAEVRQSLRQKPELLWLLCWAVGGFVLMSMIPSKRVDRIFPVLPPVALMIPSLLAAVPERSARRMRQVALACVPLALVAASAYAGKEIRDGFRNNESVLVQLGHDVQARQIPAGRLAVVFGRDEGLILYSGVLRFSAGDELRDGWQKGTIDAALLPQKWWKERADKLPGKVTLETPKGTPEYRRYVLLERATNETRSDR